MTGRDYHIIHPSTSSSTKSIKSHLIWHDLTSHTLTVNHSHTTNQNKMMSKKFKIMNKSEVSIATTRILESISTPFNLILDTNGDYNVLISQHRYDVIYQFCPSILVTSLCHRHIRCYFLIIQISSNRYCSQKIKRGASFHETSPMLSDISGMGDWAKVCTGLVRMFEGKRR